MEQLKTFFIIIISFTFGFGLWYLIFWLLTNESNLFNWSIYTKICYLLFSLMATEGISEEFKNK